MKTEQLQIRISPALKEQVKHRAASEDKTMSEWVTDLIKSNVKEGRTMKRYYIIGNDGNIWGESHSKRFLEIKMAEFSPEDIDKYELEIIEDE